ncbi:MAG: hypothetical protein ACRDRH_18020 [Pseudonocardia sp.]
MTGGTGDVNPESVAGSTTHTRPRPLFGYIRVAPYTSEKRIEELRRSMAAYASQEGFTLGRVFVDQSRLHTIALTELFHALSCGEAAHVLVPALHHLAHYPSIQAAMKELVESQTGARLLVMYPNVTDAA